MSPILPFCMFFFAIVGSVFAIICLINYLRKGDSSYFILGMCTAIMSTALAVPSIFIPCRDVKITFRDPDMIIKTKQTTVVICSNDVTTFYTPEMYAVPNAKIKQRVESCKNLLGFNASDNKEVTVVY